MQSRNNSSSKKLLFINLAVIVICFLIFSTAAAEEFKLENAIQHGINNNLEIKEQQNSINSLKRELETIRAEQGWQIEISANYNEIIDEQKQNNENPESDFGSDSYNNSTTDISGGSSAEGAHSTLSINRNFKSGLSLSQTTDINDQGENSYSVDISYPLFKGAPTESERAYYEKEQELLRAENDYNSLIEDKITTWLEDYLQILRLEKNRENTKLQLDIADKQLSEDKELYSKSQISKSELNTTEAEFIDAENNYNEINNQYNNAVESFKLALNFTEEQEIKLENSDYLKKVKENIISYQNHDFKSMYQSLLQSDYEHKSNLINLKLQEKQLEWFQKEGKADINLEGSYDDSSETSIVGVTFSYDLFDGGQREFNEENLKENIQLAEENLENLKKNKEISLESQLSRIKSAERAKDSEELKFENAQRQLESAEEQYESEIITKKELNEQKVSHHQQKNNYQEAQDELFIEELNLTMLLNNNFSENIRGVE